MVPLALPRPSSLGRRILAASAGGALVLQLAILGGTFLHQHSGPQSGTDSMLLIRDGTLADVASILTRNGAWLVAVTLLAWPIARLWSWGLGDTWDPPWINLVARGLYPAVAAVLVLSLWWIFSRQALALSEDLVGRWALVATFAHGTPEFTALLLPLCAALSCIRAPAPHPLQRLLRAFAAAVPLLVCAALVEVYVTPQLLAPLTSA